MTEPAPARGKLMQPSLWLLIVLGVAGIIFFFLRFQDSFPSASIDLRYSRSEITAIAKRWASKLGYEAAGTIDSTVFSLDDDAKTFLEYELGQKKANALMLHEIPVWSWTTRFCRPFQIETLSVALAPDGKLNYFNRSLPNDAPGPTISHPDAEKLARTFATIEGGVSLVGATTIRDSEQRQLQRTDHEFVWEDPSKEFAGGRLRTYVYVSGNQVTAFNRYLHVPEKFQRKYADIRSYNSLLKQASEIVFTILSSGVIFIFVWAFASGRVRRKFVLIAGAVAAVFSILNWIDSTPTLVAGYHTTMSFNQYWFSSVVSGAVSALVSCVATIAFIAALEPVYRLAWPEKIALEKVITEAGLRTRSVFKSLVAGLSVFGMHTAYVVGFYLVGQRLGFWSPLEIRETSLLSGLWPFYSAMDIGVSAATMEEFMYRVLALVMFKRLTNNFWLANFLQAAAWAFMHSDYPQEPAYARGVELTIGGFFYGYILKSFGLVACMVAHYTYDAFLGVTPLFGSDDLAVRLGALVAIAPGVILLLASVFLIWKRGVIEDESPLLNSAIPAGHRPDPIGPQPDQHFVYVPVGRRAIIACVVAGLIGAAALLAVPLRMVGDGPLLRISREQAVAIAREYLISNSLDPTGMSSVAVVSDDTDENELQYVFEKSGFEKTAQLAKAKEPRLLWKVRFYKPGDPKQYYVSITPDGKPLYKTIVLDEDAPGGRPPAVAVRTAIEDYLAKNRPQLQPLTLLDSSRHELKNRTDQVFTFQVPSLKVADAPFQITAGTVGDNLSGLRLGWQIPEQWQFDRSKVTPKDQALQICRVTVFGALLIWLIVWGLGIVRSGALRWRGPLAISAATAIVLAATRLNSAPSLMWYYDTDVTVSSFLSGQAIQGLIFVLSGTAASGIGAALALAAYRKYFPNHPIGALLRAAWPHLGLVTAATRRMWLDAVIIAAASSVLFAGVDHLFDAGMFLTSPTVQVLNLSAVLGVTDDWSAGLAAVLTAVTSALSVTLGIAVIAAFHRRFLADAPWKLPLVIVVLTVVANSTLRYWQDYAWTVFAYLAICAIAYVFVRRLAGFNILVYPMWAYFGALGSQAYTMVRFESFQLYYPQLAVIVLASFAPLVYIVWLYAAPRRELEVLPPDTVSACQEEIT